ncbi:MAG: aldo/keto reductase [Nitrospirae bacterium]|nr:aldo/keto reductase [Nitrospirota bacterium]
MNRRDFLKTGTLAAAASGLTAYGLTADGTEAHAAEPPKIKRYQEVGKTGMKISDISFGGDSIPSASMILRAVDRGINYFDTAPDYGRSESLIGEAMKNLKRDKVHIASKFCKPQGYPPHLQPGSSKNDYITAVEDSLKRLNTSYIDVCFVHAIGTSSKDFEAEKKRLLDENMFSAAEQLKKDGKIRFLATSSHGPANMEPLLMEAVKSGRFDLIMASFNFLKFPKLPEVLTEAKKRGVGVIAMKTLAGAKDMSLDFKGGNFAQSSFKWVLKHKEVNGLIVTMKSVTDLDNYLPASGQEFTASDQKVLDAYAALHGASYCRTGCNLCEEACAKGVEIASTLRYQMYFSDYHMEKRAIISYASLMTKAGHCSACDGHDCTGACPYGLPVAGMLKEAHENLTIEV